MATESNQFSPVEHDFVARAREARKESELKLMHWLAEQGVSTRAIALENAVRFVAGSQGCRAYDDSDFDRLLDRVTVAHAHFLDILAPTRTVRKATTIERTDLGVTTVSCAECGAAGETADGVDCLVTCSLQAFPAPTGGAK